MTYSTTISPWTTDGQRTALRQREKTTATTTPTLATGALTVVAHALDDPSGVDESCNAEASWKLKRTITKVWGGAGNPPQSNINVNAVFSWRQDLDLSGSEDFVVETDVSGSASIAIGGRTIRSTSLVTDSRSADPAYAGTKDGNASLTTGAYSHTGNVTITIHLNATAKASRTKFDSFAKAELKVTGTNVTVT